MRFFDTDLYKAFDDKSLLYGFTYPTRNLVRLELHNKARGNRPRMYITADDYVNDILGTFYAPHDTTDKTAFGLIGKDDRSYSFRRGTMKSYVKDFTQHWENLAENPRFGKLALHNNHFPKNDKNLLIFNRRVRRGCKAALFQPGVTKHFLLDGEKTGSLMDFGVIFAKPNKDYESQDFSGHRPSRDGYTAAELRFIVKNWQYLQENGLDMLVCFYLNSQRVRVTIYPDAEDPHEKICVNQEDLAQAMNTQVCYPGV